MAAMDEKLPGQSADYGPFTQAITGPLTPKTQDDLFLPHAPGTAGALALFANNFIRGLQRGQRTKYEQSEKTKQEHERNFDATFAHILNDPNISNEGKEQARKIYLQQKYGQVNEGLKGAKDNKDNPLFQLTKAITGAVLGPSENKEHKNIDVNSLLSIATGDKYKIDPNAMGQKAAQGLNSAISDIENRPGAAGGPSAIPGLKVPDLPPAPELRQEATAASVAQNPQAQAALAPLIKEGIDPRTSPYTSEILRTLPQTPKAAPIKTVPVIVPGPDGKFPEKPTPVSAYQDANGVYRDPQTHQALTGAVLFNAQVRGTVAPPLSAFQQRANARVNDIKTLHPDWSDQQVRTEAARIETQLDQAKLTAKTTPESLLAKNYLDSGKAKTIEEATRLAATDLVTLEQTKIQAAKNSANGARELTPQQIQGLAKMSLLTGQVPSFGLGKSADRTAFWAAFADLSNGGEGLGSALDKKFTLKSLQGNLNSLQKLAGTVTSFEQSAEGSLDKALEASRNLPRDSSRLLNSWTQWLSTGTTDDKDLRNFMNLTETAANEYARVISGASNGGVSTDSARKQANAMLSAAFGEGAFQGAADAMKTDMLIRTNALRKGILDTEEQIRSIGNSTSGGENTPRTPPPTVFTQQHPYVSPSGKKVWVGMTGKDKNGNAIKITAIDPQTGKLTTEPIK